MNRYQDNIASRQLTLCIECGKCVAMCPMAVTRADFSGAFSPKGIVRQVLRGASLKEMPGLASCLQCRYCSSVCPNGIDVAGLICDLRAMLSKSLLRVCSACGHPLLAEDVADYVRRAAGNGYEGELGYLGLCPSCRRKAYICNNR